MNTASSFAARDHAIATVRRISSDAQAIALCQAGDKAAYGYLVEQYKERAYYSALVLVRSHEAALDLSQDAFVRAFRHIKRFDTTKKFFTWYYQILRNLCLNFIRDAKRHARSFSEMYDTQIMHLIDDKQDTSAFAEQNELRRVLWAAMNELKPKEREIIMLKDIQDLAYKEIADILEIPIGTVMSRLFNARKALKAKLERIYI